MVCWAWLWNDWSVDSVLSRHTEGQTDAHFGSNWKAALHALKYVSYIRAIKTLKHCTIEALDRSLKHFAHVITSTVFWLFFFFRRSSEIKRIHKMHRYMTNMKQQTFTQQTSSSGDPLKYADSPTGLRHQMLARLSGDNKMSYSSVRFL